MPAVDFRITGSEQMVRRLEKIRLKFPNDMDIVVIEEAHQILATANDKFVPIETQDLRDSGEVIVTTPKGPLIGKTVIFKGTAHGVIISYGRLKATAYAEAVHEHPSAHSPPSWKGKSINWSKPGTGPKYLERPLKLAQRGMAGRVALKLKTLLNATPGAFVAGG